MCFQPHSLLIGKVSVLVMHFCGCPIHCKILESGQEARIMQNDFSAAFVTINHQGILHKLLGYWKFCVFYIDTVSMILIAACYGVGLSE